MLNTDLHNPNIRPEKKMSLESFVRNNTNYGDEVSAGIDLGEIFFERVYSEISQTNKNTMASGAP